MSYVYTTTMDLATMVEEYLEKARAIWINESNKSLLLEAENESKKIRWFGIGNLIKPNPTKEEIYDKMVAAGRLYRTWAASEYRYRISQSQYFQNVIDRYPSSSTKINLSFEDINMLHKCEYHPKARWYSAGIKIPEL